MLCGVYLRGRAVANSMILFWRRSRTLSLNKTTVCDNAASLRLGLFTCVEARLLKLVLDDLEHGLAFLDQAVVKGVFSEESTLSISRGSLDLIFHGQTPQLLENAIGLLNTTVEWAESNDIDLVSSYADRAFPKLLDVLVQGELESNPVIGI
jgi:hypothetical protein